MSAIGTHGGKLILATSFTVFACAWLAPLARADADGSVVTCAPTAPIVPEIPEVTELGPDLLDPLVRGVDLDDLDLPEAKMVAGYVRLKGTAPLSEVLAVAAVSRHAQAWVVDVLGRAPRFVDHDDHRNAKGKVGLVRMVIPIASREVCDVGLAEILWEKSLAELDLHYRVSIPDWVGVIEDPTLGFRRVYPLGGGSIDRGVRYPGVVSSLTPTTEDGLLEKTYAWRELHSPWYFRNKPYLPISVGHTFTGADGTPKKYYGQTNIAFHIWQDKGFERGYFSHGCMRLRTADLAELASFVFGVDKPIPVVVRITPFSDVRHPFPMDTKKYWQLKNYGTAEKPQTRLKWMLYETELGTLPLPPANELQAMSFSERPVALEAARAAKAAEQLSGQKPKAASP